MIEEELSLDELSLIECRFVTQHYREPEDRLFCERLIAIFDGEYGHGATGNDDAVHMSAMLAAAFSAWHPYALVLDFTGLSYEWGDMMEGPLRAGEDYRAWDGGLPAAVATSARNEPALRSLLDNMMVENPDDWLYPTRAAAIARVPETLRARNAASDLT